MIQNNFFVPFTAGLEQINFYEIQNDTISIKKDCIIQACLLSATGGEIIVVLREYSKGDSISVSTSGNNTTFDGVTAHGLGSGTNTNVSSGVFRIAPIGTADIYRIDSYQGCYITQIFTRKDNLHEIYEKLSEITLRNHDKLVSAFNALQTAYNSLENNYNNLLQLGSGKLDVHAYVNTLNATYPHFYVVPTNGPPNYYQSGSLIFLDGNKTGHYYQTQVNFISGNCYLKVYLYIAGVGSLILYLGILFPD